MKIKVKLELSELNDTDNIYGLSQRLQNVPNRKMLDFISENPDCMAAILEFEL